jgi:teichuronic acid biosynthesis glycosyltransferase TuaC
MDAPALPPWLPQRPLRILSVSTMFPSEALPVHAVFVRHRLLALARLADVRVLSPVPDFPLVARFVEKYAPRLRIPTEQVHARGGAPPAGHLPAILLGARRRQAHRGVSLARRCSVSNSSVWSGRKEGARRLIDAHLAFPDGFGAVLVAAQRWAAGDRHPARARHQRPRTIPDPLAAGQFALRQRDAGLRRLPRADRRRHRRRCAPGTHGGPGQRGRSGALSSDSARRRPTRARAPAGPAPRALRGPPGRAQGFPPARGRPEAAARRRAWRTSTWSSWAPVGKKATSRRRCRRGPRRSAEVERVHFVGAVPNDRLFRYYSAADAFALASEKEGWPNVLFEALACGTPPVATRVWGTPECLHRPEYGVLVEDRSGEGLARGLRTALERTWDRDLLIRYARGQHLGGRRPTLSSRAGPRPGRAPRHDGRGARSRARPRAAGPQSASSHGRGGGAMSKAEGGASAPLGGQTREAGGGAEP